MKEMTTKFYEQFMLESNMIEREYRLNPGDMEAITYATERVFWDEERLMQMHRSLGSYLKEPWVGQYRTCNVWIGNSAPPDWQDVPKLMEDFFEDLDDMSSWEAHNEFERIHPFRDLNGRTGRLIWLSKALDEGYSFNIPFLQMYYYQTLDQYRIDDEMEVSNE